MCFIYVHYLYANDKNTRILRHSDFSSKNTFVLPATPKDDGTMQHVIYTLFEYDPLIDSSNIDSRDYRQIASDILQSYDRYDGFVIVHGTDTMAYSAASLSFMLKDLGKPVIFTGAQKPMAEMRTDAIDNIQGSLVMAGTVIIPEVCVLFNRTLFRGNRVCKFDTEDYNAFRSFNMEPLAKLGTRININWDAVWRVGEAKKFSVTNGWNPNVALLRLFPCITATTVRSFLQPPVRGVVLQTYGSGNGPDNRLDILREISLATARGVIILNISQCQAGSVSVTYESGASLRKAGVIQGADMTAEAALAKLCYVLAKEGLTTEERKKLLMTNLRGELTQPDLKRLTLNNSVFLSTVADSLRISSKAELEQIKQALFPSLMCSAAKLGDMETVKMLKREGGDYAVADYDGRTPLHIASAEGHNLLIEEMLKECAPVHARDRHGRTPLNDAIMSSNFQAIELLVNAGANIKQTEYHIANELCTLALMNNLNAITAWHMGGAHLDSRNYDGRTALHIAVAEENEDIVRYLISQGCDPNLKDRMGRTPFSELSKKTGSMNELLEWGESLKRNLSECDVFESEDRKNPL